MPQLELFSPVREQEDLSKKKEAKEDKLSEKKQLEKAADIQLVSTEQLSPGISQFLQDGDPSPENADFQPEDQKSTSDENPGLQPGEPQNVLQENPGLQQVEPENASPEIPAPQPEKAENALPEISMLQQEEPANTVREKLNVHPGQPANAVVFSDGKISVRIKSKERAPAEAVITPEQKAVPQPEEKIRPLKSSNGRGRRSFKEMDAAADLVEVPEDEVLFQKQYYAISTVAEWFKVNTSLLRFWENEFDILKPRKNKKGDRMFRPEDVKNLQLIYHLLRHRKYTIDGAKEYLKSNKSAADAQLQLTQTLQKLKLFLLELKANL